MVFLESPLKGAYTIQLTPHTDNRGFFARVFCKNEFREIRHQNEFVQYNHSRTEKKGSLRGLHFQIPPRSEIKLVRCIRGKVIDIIVDLRNGSRTFLQHFSVVLSAENMKMIYIPEGFAHGFQTLEDHSEMLYFHTDFYAPEFERGIRFDDPRLQIEWPLRPEDMSEKDMNHPLLTEEFKGLEI